MISNPKRHLWSAAAVMVCTWLYLAAVLAAWMLLGFGGDRWWLATVLLFGPRWPYAIPWIVLAPFVAKVKPRLLWPMTAAAVVLLGPIMGLCLPWARLVAHDGQMVRVLTCNVDGKSVDPKRLAALVAEAQPDVVALQEWSASAAINWPPGWHIVHAGELLVASPYRLDNVESAHRRHPPSRWPPVDALRCTVEMPAGPIGFCCVHLLTPRSGLNKVLDRQTVVNPERSVGLSAGIADRRLESEEVMQWLQGPPETQIVTGDFNMPTDSAIYRASWTNYVNAFSVSGFGFGYTKWTPVGGWPFGLRIDHILAAPALKACRCWVGPDVGSDHLPLLADLAMPSGYLTSRNRRSLRPRLDFSDAIGYFSLVWHTKSPSLCWSMRARSWSAPRRFESLCHWVCLSTKSRNTSTGWMLPEVRCATHRRGSPKWEIEGDKCLNGSDLRRVAAAGRQPRRTTIICVIVFDRLAISG